MRLTLHTFLTLDGVMQAPGGPDEDREGGFTHGGWSFPYGDEEFANPMIGWFEHADAFLLGRKTYDIFNGYWPQHDDADDPIASRLNRLPKHVASRSRSTFEWANTAPISVHIDEPTMIRPSAMRYRGWILSVKKPAIGIIIIVMTPPGDSDNPACVAS